MKIERQLEGHWLASQRTDTGRLLLAEGTTRQDATQQLRFLMLDMHDPLPAIDVSEEWLCPEKFAEIFGRR